MTTVWVITGERGEYDSLQTWIESIWSNESDAKMELLRLENIQTRLADERVGQRGYAYWSREEMKFYDGPTEFVLDPVIEEQEETT